MRLQVVPAFAGRSRLPERTTLSDELERCKGGVDSGVAHLASKFHRPGFLTILNTPSLAELKTTWAAFLGGVNGLPKFDSCQVDTSKELDFGRVWSSAKAARQPLRTTPKRA